MTGGGSPDDEESYHLLVTPYLERMLTQLSQPAHAAQDAPPSAPLCPSCKADVEALGLPASGIHCPHAR